MKVSIELSPADTKRLRSEAGRLGVTPERLAHAAISDLLAREHDDFDAAARRVLEKNRELYRRLRALRHVALRRAVSLQFPAGLNVNDNGPLMPCRSREPNGLALSRGGSTSASRQARSTYPPSAPAAGSARRHQPGSRGSWAPCQTPTIHTVSSFTR